MTESRTYAELPTMIILKQWDRKPFLLHREIGKGTAPDGRKIEMIQAEGGRPNIYVTIGDKTYELDVMDLTKAILDAEEKQADPKGERKSDMWPEKKEKS
jgi:hypothetical protein